MYEDDENHEEMHTTALAESKVVEKERMKEKTAAAARLPGAQSTKSS